MKKHFKDIFKRFLAITCAFALISSSVVASDVSENSTSELTDKELYVIELLNAIDIYNGVDAVIGKDDFVRRDVFAFLTARIMGVNNITYQGEPLFSDVGKDNFAYNAINLLAQANIIKGTENGKFEPFADITLDEATEIILRIMGYTELLDLQGSAAVRELVQKHKLHRGIKYAKDKRLQVRYLSFLLYNALVTDFPQVVSLSGSDDFQYFEYRMGKNENLLAKVFDVYEVKGVISANNHTSTNVNSGVSNGLIKIGDEAYYIGKTEADKYVGYYVSAYYHSGDRDTLLCIDVGTNNSVVVLNSDNVEYSNFKYTTYLNRRKTTYNISKGLNLIYNGKAIYYDKALMIPEYGTITLIDNDNDDSVYETVVINAVRNLVVGSYGTNSNIIQSKYDNLAIDLNKYSENDCSIHKADGKPYKITSIKEWDVLSVVESADGECIDITVSTDTVTGTVENVCDSDGTTVITIDDNEYEVASTFRKNINYNLTTGYFGTFYLDMFGRIAASNGNVTKIKWGYHLKARRGKNLSDLLKVKILSQDSGKVETYETSNKFFFNDVKYTESNIDSLVLNDYQAVRYSLDKNGKIQKLYTVGNGFVELKAKYADGFAINAFGNNIAMDSNTIIFQTPNVTRAGDDQDDESFYTIKPLSSFKNGEWYWVSAYGIKEDDVAASLVVVERFYSSANNPAGTYMVVSEVISCLDKDGFSVNKIIGYDSAKNKVEILTRDIGDAAKFGIDKGDVFAMVLYPDGTINRAVEVYDYKTGVLSSRYSGIAYDLQNFARSGYAYNISSRFLQLSDDQFSFYNSKVYSTSSATILIVDTKSTNDIVSVGSLADIKTFKQSGEAAKVVVYGRESIPRLIVSYQ